MMNPYILLFFMSVILASASQMLLKKSAEKKHDSILREYLNIHVVIGYSLLLLTTLLNIYAYSKGVEMKTGVVIESLSFVLILILSRVIFGEKITPQKAIGNVLIIFGVVIFNL